MPPPIFKLFLVHQILHSSSARRRWTFPRSTSREPSTASLGQPMRCWRGPTPCSPTPCEGLAATEPLCSRPWGGVMCGGKSSLRLSFHEGWAASIFVYRVEGHAQGILVFRMICHLSPRSHRLHYLPAKNRPQDFSDSSYQSQLPPHARSTAAQVDFTPGVTQLASNTMIVLSSDTKIVSSSLSL